MPSGCLNSKVLLMDEPGLPLSVLPPGTECVICRPDKDHIPATIVSVSVCHPRRVSYEVLWWDGYTRHQEWLETLEIRITNNTGRRMEIGFTR